MVTLRAPFVAERLGAPLAQLLGFNEAEPISWWVSYLRLRVNRTTADRYIFGILKSRGESIIIVLQKEKMVKTLLSEATDFFEFCTHSEVN